MLAVYQEGDRPVPGYQLVRFLGRGGFGQVWKARAPGGAEVALKLIDLQGHQGIKEFRAIRLVKTIRHPNLAPILAFWLKDQVGKLIDDAEIESSDSAEFLDRKPAELVIAMGLGDKNLLNRLEECRKQKQSGVPVLELLKYIEGAAEAIDFLNGPTHDLGNGQVAIRHGDIKPQNILIVGGAAQVCDFGLASVLGDARSTNPTVSFAYVAPETLDNRPTKWTDQYSLAISYYELRTGELPFPAANMPMILRANAEGKLDLSKLPPSEQAVIKRATDLTPAKRYPTTEEMAKALRRAVEGTRSPRTVTAGPDGLLRLEPGLELVPGYKLVKHLGSGSYGKVWEASAPGGIHVALKIIEQLAEATGRQEFKALELIKRVEHNHLMDLLAYWLLDADGQLISDEDRAQADGRQPATLIIACKLAKSNLAQRLKECLTKTSQGIPPLELLRYMRQAAKAIDHLNAPQHKLDDEKVVSIQHRDIKPENILLAGDAVKVADFGLAKIVEGTSALVHSGSAGLTLAYAAPEMFENKVTQWTDQYCLALTYYHLRTGTLPFTNVNSPSEIIAAHVYGKLDLSRLPEAEQKALARATSTLPELRYPTCVEMVEALYEAVFGADVKDDSYLMEKAQADRVSSGAHRAPPPLDFPIDATTPTRPVSPEVTAAAADRAGVAKGRSGSHAHRGEPDINGGETQSAVVDGTIIPPQLKRKSQRTTLPPPPVPVPKPRPMWLMPMIGGVLGLVIVGAVIAAMSLGGSKPIASTTVASSGSDSRTAEVPTKPSIASSSPPTQPMPPVQPSVATRLERGRELLASNPQEAEKVFSDLEKETGLTLADRRQALIGLARAQARLRQWSKVEDVLRSIKGVEFQSLQTADIDEAVIAALDLLDKQQHLADREVLKLLAGMRKEHWLGALKGWEETQTRQVIKEKVQALARTLPEMTPRDAAALAKELIALEPPRIELYRELAESVLNKENSPAKSESALDEEMQELIDLFDKPSVVDGDKSEIAKLHGQVLAKDVEWRVPFANSSTNWKARLAECQKADETGWVLACSAECLLETNGDLDAALTKATNPKVDKVAGDYAKYLQARILKLTKKTDDALKTLVQVSPYSPWLAAPERTRPLYRGSKAAELLLTNLAGIYSDAQSASNILARDPTLKQSTLDEFRKTIGPTIQRIVRAKAYDPVEAEKKLAQLNNLIASFAAPFDKLADKSLKAYDSETNKTRKNEQLSLALECAEGYKAVGGDPIEAARLLGTIYGEKQDWAFALQSFNEGLPRQQGSPSGFDLDKIQTRHFGLLLSRTYFILDHLDELTREQLTFPDGLIQPAAKAAELAAKDMALTSRKGEALGAAGWALHAAAEEWKRDPTKVPTVCSWRLRAFQYLKEALGSSLEATKKRYGWKWRTLIAIQVDELLDVPEARAKASDYVDTAITQLNTGIEELNDALKEVADGLKKDIPPEKRRELEAQRKELGDEKNDLETRIIRLKEKRPGPANSTGT